ncbi:YceH family protein [Dokdonella sp.]|uniref:YceH family protein n=1 Tax=Dokdonella sp. TaxID=2291710 RepID=UPI0025B822C2|nr:YceH family protein [Dokdonella sp.]MBX3693525.1 YceH family protein [Dokdonella sp.]MCW5567501.1 YceH family protein [Dokdonella sp.]
MTNAETTGAAAPEPLDAVQARILGCLVEKQATTPDVYPLTLNAIVAACNQKSNREPVSDHDPGTVGHALRGLEGRGLVTGSLAARASRYAHRFDAGYGVTPRQRAVLAVLMLRGAQTANELFLRCERLAEFGSADEVREVLERLATREPALALCIGRAAGQREDRWMHLLCGPVDAAAALSSHTPAPAGPTQKGLAERVERLESLVESLQAGLDELRRRPPGEAP